MAIKLVRVDERLIHGQVTQAWLPYLGIDRIVVVSDEVYADRLQRELMECLSGSCGVGVVVHDMERFITHYREGRFEDDDCMVIFPSLSHIRRLAGEDICFPKVNIGNIHFCDNRKKVSDTVYLSDEERKMIGELKALGVSLSIRCVPTDREVSV